VTIFWRRPQKTGGEATPRTLAEASPWPPELTLPRPKPVDWLVLAGLVIAWGSAFGALKIAVHEIPPVWNTVGRLWIASVTLGVICAINGERLPKLSDPAWRYYGFNGLIGMAAPFFLFAYAAEGLPSAVNAICNGVSPIFTAVLAHGLLKDERLGARRFFGVMVGFAGLVVLVAPRLARDESVETLALAFALTGALMYAVSNVVTRKAPPVPSSIGALIMCISGAAFATAAAPFIQPLPDKLPHLPALMSVIGLGVFTTAIAGVGYVFLIKRLGPVFMSMAIYLAPLWAMAVGVILLGERPGWPAYVALSLILLGVALATRGPRTVR
jgi:drug/metabolite transporter (DMT)-like permease